MRIAGNKPDPSNLADIVSNMDADAETAGFGDDNVGLPPEPPPPVEVPPVAKAARKRKGAPATAKPLGPALTNPAESNDPPPEGAPDDKAEFEQEHAAATGKPVIEKGVPIPPHGNVGAIRYPFRDMDEGDSFFVKQEDGESRKKLSARVRSASAQFRRRSTGETVTFTTRMEKNGIRVWRVT